MKSSSEPPTPKYSRLAATYAAAVAPEPRSRSRIVKTVCVNACSANGEYMVSAPTMSVIGAGRRDEKAGKSYRQLMNSGDQAPEMKDR